MRRLEPGWRIVAAAALLVPLAASSARAAMPPSCERLRFAHEIEPPLNEDEALLLCGDPTLPEWKWLPQPQLEFHLKAVLAARGYHFPAFVVSADRSTTVIRPGELSRVTEVILEGLPPGVEIPPASDLSQHPMNAATMKEVEEWLAKALGAEGYPCPVIRVSGETSTGALRAAIDPGPKRDFSVVSVESVEGSAPGLLRRYHPFEPGQTFRLPLLTLAEERTTASGIVFSNHFTVGCFDRSAPDVEQHVVAGPPRIFRLALGANTEVGPVIRVEWQHGRFGTFGSSVRAGARLNFREQRLSASARIFPGPDPAAKLHVAPELSLGRTDGVRLSYFSFTNRVGIARWLDEDGRKLSYFLGPGSQLLQRLQGVGLDQTFTAALELELEVIDHELELGRGNPQQGMLLNLDLLASARGVLSNHTALRVKAAGVRYWNVLGFSPPRLVLSARLRGVTTLTDAAHDSALLLPLNYRNYLGGIHSLRGFATNEVPLAPEGALTLVSASGEARIGVPGVKPLYALAFWDFGLLGARSLKLDSGLFHSPGFGLYWVSPIGVIQATLAKGFPAPSHWQFYLALGEGV